MLAMDRVVRFAIDQRAAKNLHKYLILRRCRSTCLRWSYLRLMAYSICIFHQFFVCVWSQFWLLFFYNIVEPENKIKNRFAYMCVYALSIAPCGKIKQNRNNYGNSMVHTLYCHNQLTCRNWIWADLYSYTRPVVYTSERMNKYSLSRKKNNFWQIKFPESRIS